jgi:sulfatase maturation enzyme AslB (radical SAM superfamily)
LETGFAKEYHLTLLGQSKEDASVVVYRQVVRKGYQRDLLMTALKYALPTLLTFLDSCNLLCPYCISVDSMHEDS